MSRCMKCYSDKGKGTYCDDCRAVIANEKRLQALAELQAEGHLYAEQFADKQADGEMMEKFDLEKEAKAYCAANKVYPSESDLDTYKAGFNKGAELERERALDLVMEWIKESDRNFYECNECSFQMRITTFLSQLRDRHES